MIKNINCVILGVNSKVYFFEASQYYRYNLPGFEIDQNYPKPIKGNWPGVWESDVDSAVNWSNGKAYFFKGNEYTRYDFSTHKADSGYPKPISGNWPGLWAGDIEAAVNWGNGKAYFFKGNEYIRYDLKADKADPGYPKPIAGNWPGLWDNGINAAVNWGNGKAYFFRGDEVISYDISADSADSGYPKKISDKWQSIESKTPVQLLRQAIGEVAINEFRVFGSSVEAKNPGGKDASNGRTFRKGHERLLEYFRLAAPDPAKPGSTYFGDNEIQYLKTQGSLAPMPHWCGIFALWAVKTALIPAGFNAGNWKMGYGLDRNYFYGLTSKPQKGDVAYKNEPYQHHAIVYDVQTDETNKTIIETIDGNSGASSTITHNFHPIGHWSAFLSLKIFKE